VKPGESVGFWVFGRLARVGMLEMTTPDGRVLTIGTGAPTADIQVHDYSIVTDVIRRGLIGFAEAYMSGALDTEDLRQLLAWGVANQRSWFDHPLAKMTLPVRRLWQRITASTKPGWTRR
jgi:hypothetical protein